MKGLRNKSPLRLATEGALAGGFMVFVATQGHFSAAWQAAVGIGIVCGVIGLVYRATRSARGVTPTGERRATKLFGRWTISKSDEPD